MQVRSIISHTIPEEILNTGHLSIRLMADGFSLLLEDQSYTPIIINHFINDQKLTKTGLLTELLDWLDRHTLKENFRGEITITGDRMPFSLVPKQLFDKNHMQDYLDGLILAQSVDTVRYREIKNRPFHIVYGIGSSILHFAKHLSPNVRIIPPSQVILSMADQVNAATHQRGFALLEVQEKEMNILLIKEDTVQLMNQLTFKDESELIYHTLNTLKQADFNLRKAPLYLAGIPSTELQQKLGKYIRNIDLLQYFIKDMDKEDICEHILLAEATKCE